ncbi:unnamed protein product, partial [Prorocentrum cordatum]
VDCFSAGVLLYTCLAGHGPFQGRHLKEVLVKKLHNSVSMQAMTWFPPGARDLVTQLSETRPEDRPTAGQCLRHPWLQRPRAKGLQRQCEEMQTVVKCTRELGCYDSIIRGACANLTNVDPQCALDCGRAPRAALGGPLLAALLAAGLALRA